MLEWLFGKKETSVVEEEPVKFCKDCEHFEPDMDFSGFENQCAGAKCSRPMEFDLVCGRRRGVDTYCSSERKNDCGKEAKYFKAKTCETVTVVEDGVAMVGWER